jgi:hypothetical protein
VSVCTFAILAELCLNLGSSRSALDALANQPVEVAETMEEHDRKLTDEEPKLAKITKRLDS